MKTEIKNILLLLGILTCFGCRYNAAIRSTGASHPSKEEWINLTIDDWVDGSVLVTSQKKKESTEKPTPEQPSNKKTDNSGFKTQGKKILSSTVTNQGDNKEFTIGGVSFTMVYVQGGTFTMGATSEQGSDVDDDEKPAHSVTLSNYYIGETEVTQELWKAVMGSNPSIFTGDSQRPVEKVSWDDCQTFINKLNSLTGQRFHLPTEAQWEYAARGGSKSRGYKYAGSNTLNNVAWYAGNSGSSTHPVKTKFPNELGLYDMSGNVWEWCQDWFGSYSGGAQTNPTGSLSGASRVPRGGSWIFNARSCRVSGRGYYTPSNRDNYLGLRLAL